MSASNGNGEGVIRIGRKGIKKFAFGDDGPVFDVDVVAAIGQWGVIDETMRQKAGEHVGKILDEDMPTFYQEVVAWVEGLAGSEYKGKITKAEALDFKARLTEQYSELVVFFQPRKRDGGASPASSGVGLEFSEEPDPSPSSMSTSSER